MSCKININDPLYSQIRETVTDEEIAFKLYLQEKLGDALIASSTEPKFQNKLDKSILRIFNNRLKVIDERLKSKKGNKFALNQEKVKIEEYITQVKGSTDNSQIYNTIQNYLRVIELGINNDTITEDQLQSYFRDVKLFQDFSLNLLNGEEESPIEKIIAEKAKNLSLRLEPLIIKTVKKYAREQNIDLTTDDLKYLKNANTAAMWTLDLSTDSNIFMQYVNKVTKQAAALRDFTLQNELKKLQEIEEKLGDTEKERLEKKQKIFKQVNGKIYRNKIVTRQSDAFFKKYYELKREVDEFIGKDKPIEYRAKRKALFNWLSENTTFINPNYFTASEVEKDKIFNDLVSKVGSEAYAQELIEQAEKKFNVFKSEFTQFKEWVNNKEDLSDTEKEEMIRARNIQFNPQVYYDVFIDRENAKVHNVKMGDYFSEQFVVFAPLASKPEWFSQEYKEIENDKALSEYYGHVKNVMNKYKSFLPDYATEDAYRQDYIYRAKTGLIEMFNNSGVKSVLPKITSNLVDAFSTRFEHEYVGEIDSEGKEVGSVPVQKLISIDDEIANLEKRISEEKDKVIKESLLKRLNELQTQYTIDPSRSLEVFLAMAVNFRFMSEISDELKLAQDIIATAKSKEANGTYGDAQNTKKRLNNHINVVLYGNSKDVEGQHKSEEDFEDNLFEAKDLIGLPSAQKIKAKELSKKIKSQTKAYGVIAEKADNEEKLTDEEKSIKQNYEKMIADYRALGGKRFTWSSFFDSAILWQMWKTFAFNPTSAFVNLMTGMAAVSTEASGKQHFNGKDLSFAYRAMFDSVKKYMSFGNITGEYSDKITTLAQKFGIVEDVLEVKQGKNFYKRSTLESATSPFNWLRSGDFFMKMTGVVATMKSDKKWKVKTKEGKEIALWEAFNNKGEWKTELFDEQTNFEFNGDPLSGGSEKLAEYRNYLRQLNSSMHGNFDRESAVLAKRNVIGRLIGQYKLSWMPQAIFNRFGDEYYNMELGEFREGRYRTLGRLASEKEDLGKTLFTRAITLLIKSNSIEGLSETEVANLNKTKADIKFYIMITAFMMMLKHLAMDDDEKEKGSFSKLLYNQLYQLQKDYSFYISPMTFKNLTSQVIPAVSILTDGYKTIKAANKYIVEDDRSKDEENLERLWKKFMNNFPFTRTIVSLQTKSEKLLESFEDK